MYTHCALSVTRLCIPSSDVLSYLSFLIVLCFRLFFFYVLFFFSFFFFFFFFSSRRRHTRFDCDWSSDVCSSDLPANPPRIWCPCTNRFPCPRTLSTIQNLSAITKSRRPSSLFPSHARRLWYRTWSQLVLLAACLEFLPWFPGTQHTTTLSNLPRRARIADEYILGPIRQAWSNTDASISWG